MNPKFLRFSLLTAGILVTAVPAILVTQGWQGWALAGWFALVLGGVNFFQGKGGSNGSLPEFIDKLTEDGRIRLDLRCEQRNEITCAINGFLESADNKIMDISASAGRLVPISRELADGYMMIHQKSQMQNQYGAAVAASVRRLEEMRAQVHAENTEISCAVGEAVKGAEESLATVAVTSSGMQELAETTAQAAKQVDVLASVNSEILAIADTITDIAGSTNLLALNAAIEAARAGEHGRGFAVVADEVRRLSAQTQAATANIRELADSVGAESEKTVSHILKTRESAVATEQAMHKATSEINDIAAAVQRIKGLSDEITDAMARQQEVAVSASDHVNALVDLNESVVNDQNHGVTEGDLLKLAEVLRVKLSHFVLSEEGWDDQLRPKKENTAATGAPVSLQPDSAGGSDSAADDIELF